MRFSSSISIDIDPNDVLSQINVGDVVRYYSADDLLEEITIGDIAEHLKKHHQLDDVLEHFTRKELLVYLDTREVES